MFRQLAEEESEHLERLQSEYKALIEENGWLRREPSRLPASRKIADEIFPQRKLLQVEVSDETTHLEALSIAIDLERRSHHFSTTLPGSWKTREGARSFAISPARNARTWKVSLKSTRA